MRQANKAGTVFGKLLPGLILLCLPGFDPAQSSDSTEMQIVSGTVLKREEIWDRRTNPMMGRPDVLTEILFDIRIELVQKGNLAKGSIVRLSAKEQNLLIRCKSIWKGQGAIFIFKGKQSPYVLLNLDKFLGRGGSPPKPVPVPPPPPPKPRPVKDSLDDWFSFKGGKEMRGSESLQRQATRLVSKKFKMQKVQFMTLVSHSGPCPPQGGYVYWGVKGQIQGKWFVWQPGYGPKPKPGEDLEDPQRYNK